MTASKTSQRVLRQAAKMQYVPLDRMRVREGVSQREYREPWADHLYRNFSLERMAVPVVNHVGSWYWIVDGQHRISALKRWLGDWEGQQVECLVYRNLSEKQEADLFLALNDSKNVSAFDKYVTALTAGYADEVNTDAIVQLKGLKVSRSRGEGVISSVTTLLRVYRRGADCLARTLEIANESFGDAGLDADILDGTGLVLSRYDGRIEDKRAIQALSTVRAGVSGIRNRAERLRQQTGAQKAACIAAAVVEAYNRGKGGKKLPNWWKSEEA